MSETKLLPRDRHQLILQESGHHLGAGGAERRGRRQGLPGLPLLHAGPLLSLLSEELRWSHRLGAVGALTPDMLPGDTGQ